METSMDSYSINGSYQNFQRSRNRFEETPNEGAKKKLVFQPLYQRSFSLQARYSNISMFQYLIHLRKLLGDVIDSFDIIAKANSFEDVRNKMNNHLPLTFLFGLKVLEERIPCLKRLRNVFVTKDCLYCSSCETHEDVGDKSEDSSFYKSLVVNNKVSRGNRACIQLFWNMHARTEKKTSKLCKTCNGKLIRLKEIKIQGMPGDGLIINIEKSSEEGTKKKERRSYEVEDEIEVRNEQHELHGDLTTYQLVCGIEECPYGEGDSDLEETFINERNMSRTRSAKKLHEQLVFHFKKEEKFFKVFKSERLGISNRESLENCQLLFYKRKFI